MIPKGQWIVIAVMLIQSGQASVIKFEAFPQELKANLTEEASMRCSISDSASSTIAASIPTAADIHHISSIFILRNDGDDVASITPFEGPMALADIGSLEAKGAISGMYSGEGFIQLTWRDPSTLQLGDYQCSVAAVDAKGHTVVLTSDLRMTSVPPSVMDVIAEFKRKDAQQKTRNDQQQQQIVSQSASIASQASSIASQAASITQLQQKLTACSSPRVAFTAVFGAKYHNIRAVFGDNQVMKFDKIITNVGGDYNSSSGEFVCRTPGMYTFTVHVLGTADSSCLQLQLNSVEVTSLYAYDTSTHAAASTGAVIHLKAGDVVMVKTSCSSEVYQNADLPHPNVFTGILHQSDDCRA